MTDDPLAPEHQPGAPYSSELREDARELGQCYVCRDYDDLERLCIIQVDAVGHERLVCEACWDKEKTR